MADVIETARFLQVESLNEVARAAENGIMQCCLCQRVCNGKPAKLGYVGMAVNPGPAPPTPNSTQNVGYVACQGCIALTANEDDLQRRVGVAIDQAARRGDRMMRIECDKPD